MKKEKRFEKYKSWVLKHKKYPSQISKNKIEKSLGIWRSSYRKEKFKPLLDFDKEVNFKSCKSPEEKFTEDYIPWVLKNKKYPNQRSNDKIERSLGIWRIRQGKKKFKLLLNFDKEINFNKTRKSPEKRFEEYKSWVLKYERYPSRSSDDKIEKSLGNWRSRNRSKKFKPLLDFDKEVNFKSPKSPKSPEKRFEKYKSWVLKHKKYPSEHSKNEMEKSLGIWRRNHRRDKFKLLLDFDKEFNFKSRKSPEERFEEYKFWVLEHKKYPNSHSDDKIEKYLGQWRSRHRSKIEQLKNFDIFYSNYLIGNEKAVEIFNELKEKGII